MSIFFIGIITLFLSGLISMLFNQKIKTAVLACITSVSAVLTLIPALKVLISGQDLMQVLNFNQIFGNVNFVIDPLSAFFIIVISVMSLASVIYSRGYLNPYIEQSKNINF